MTGPCMTKYMLDEALEHNCSSFDAKAIRVRNHIILDCEFNRPCENHVKRSGNGKFELGEKKYLPFSHLLHKGCTATIGC